MGKRELLLIVAFVIVGAVVYQATAPPPDPNERTFSLSGILEKVRREMRGHPASAETTRVFTHELEPGMNEVRVGGRYVELTISGEDRTNVEARFRVSSNGYDEAEARQLVERTVLKVDRTSTLGLTADYPVEGRQRAFLTLLVPKKLAVRVDQGASRTTISNVASAEISGVRGETTVKKIAGRATITHRAGRLLIEEVGALKLTGRSSDATVTHVRGEASFAINGGELTASAVGGPIDVDAQNVEVVFKGLDRAHGSVRVVAVGGSVSMDGLGNDARVDGRNAEIEIAMSRPAPLVVHSEGGELVSVTAPSAGFTLDARAAHASITVPDEWESELKVGKGDDDEEQRASGAVRGGGPPMTLRSRHGDIRILAGEPWKPEREPANTEREPKLEREAAKPKGRR